MKTKGAKKVDVVLLNGGVVESEGTEFGFSDRHSFSGLGEGKLVPKTINGVECLVGLVQFVEPRHWWDLLNPLAQVRDAEGNRFFVLGLLGHVIALESAKRMEPAGVVCCKRGRKEFEVVRWF